MFYAELYGEVWEISASLRVLNPISTADAQAQGLIRLKLPDISEAVSGRRIVFSGVRNDA